MIPVTIADETMMTVVTSRHVNRDNLNLIPKYTSFPLPACKAMNPPRSVGLSIPARELEFATFRPRFRYGK
jgi:hypothetical protein